MPRKFLPKEKTMTLREVTRLRNASNRERGRPTRKGAHRLRKAVGTPALPGTQTLHWRRGG